MEKLDLTKKYKSSYTAKTSPTLVNLEKAQYLSIRGSGDPLQKPFSNKVEALYSAAYAVKFIYKAEKKDFVVSKLEGLWWFDEEKYKQVSLANTPHEVKREDWQYTLLIRMPDYVKERVVEKAMKELKNKKNIDLAEEIKLFTISEGQAVQIMHVGPFSAEPQTLQKLQEFIQENTLKRNGIHHEIYLSDFRRTPPEKLRTILREPVM